MEMGKDREEREREEREERESFRRRENGSGCEKQVGQGD